MSLLHTGQQRGPVTAIKKERRKSHGAAGVCVGSPHSCVPEMLAGSLVPDRLWGLRGRLGMKCRGTGGLAENKSQCLGAVTLCTNWFRQTKLHCPLTRTNKPSQERLKFTGDLKYLPWYLIRLITTSLLYSHWQKEKTPQPNKKSKQNPTQNVWGFWLVQPVLAKSSKQD